MAVPQARRSSGMLQDLIDGIRQQIARYENREFLDGAMAACALVATADGTVSFSERSRMDQVVANLERLQVFDVHEATDAFNGHVEAIEDAPVPGVAQAMQAVTALADEPEAARLLVRICVAMSQADGRLDPSERQCIERICAELGVPVPRAELESFGPAAGG
jgi:tellurite resistance protein TerB